jgi:hypothetical protein
MGEVAKLVPQNRQQLLDSLDRFKAKIEAGEMDGFFLVGVGRNDDICPMWGACGPGVTILRGLGAIESLKHKFLGMIDWGAE